MPKGGIWVVVGVGAVGVYLAYFGPLSAVREHHLGLEMHQSGKYQEAIRHFDAALRDRPELVDAWVARAVSNNVLAEGDPANADKIYASMEKDCETALALDADHPAALALRGRSRLMRRQFDQAVSDLERAARLDPDFPAVFANLADAQQGLGRVDQAIRSATEALRRNPADNLAYVVRGNLRLQQGRFEEALRDADAAQEVSTSYLSAYELRSGAHLGLKQVDAAVAEAETAVRIAPKAGRSHMILAWALQAAGRFAESIRECDQAESFGFDFWNLFNVRGAARLQMIGDDTGPEVPEKVARALVDVDRSIELKRDNPDAWVCRAVAHFRQAVQEWKSGRHEEGRRLMRLAQEDIRESLRLGVGWPGRANALQVQGQIESNLEIMNR